MGSRVTSSKHVKVLQLICKAGLCKEIVKVIAAELRNLQHVFIRKIGLDSYMDVVDGILLHEMPLYSR